MKNLVPALLLIPVLASAQEAIGTNGRFQKVEGVKLYYEDWGKGEKTLVLLHSFGYTASQWRPFIPEWLSQYRVIAVDLPGHGRSEPMDTSDIFLHKRAAELVHSLLSGMGVSAYSIMGASSGGIIALYVASSQPDKVERLITIGAQTKFTEQSRHAVTQLGPLYQDAEYMRMAAERHGVKKAYQLGRQTWRFRIQHSDPHLTAIMLASVKARTLIIHGDNDDVASVSNAIEMYQHVPGASLWIVPGGKHLPHLNKRFQPEFFRTLSEFLYSK